ncbi:PilZ domain-containing protein [bacterium]|nr:PilZ domain-containing protein [candidate division CSSED10-310 bacterium]
MPMRGEKRQWVERRFPRKLIRTDISYQYRNEKLNRTYAGSGRTINLSLNGALIRIENYLPPRSDIDLYITTKDGKQVTTLSRVVHCHRVAFNVYEVGVQFLKVFKSD